MAPTPSEAERSTLIPSACVTEVVVVHGAFHEMWGPSQVLSRWIPALRDGAWLAGGTLDDASVGAAFYGDLFRHLPGTADSDDELREIAAQAGLTDALRNRLGEDGMAAVVKALGMDMVRRVVDQAGRYLADPVLRERVIQRVADAVDDDTRVIVAHSLGTIVSYQALVEHPEWPVRTFITIGSPLGNIELLGPHLGIESGAAPWPGGVETWTNITAPTDQVCAGTVLSNVFPAVVDAVVDNGHRGHDPEPYLCAQATGTALVAGLA